MFLENWKPPVFVIQQNVKQITHHIPYDRILLNHYKEVDRYVPTAISPKAAKSASESRRYRALPSVAACVHSHRLSLEGHRRKWWHSDLQAHTLPLGLQATSSLPARSCSSQGPTEPGASGLSEVSK